jgi:phage tail sheath protein FI
VKSVDAKTPDYFDNNGNPKNQYTASLPIIGSGSFTEATGNIVGKGDNSYYETISNTDIQGLVGNDYSQSLKLLANKDEYKYNVLVTPGLVKNSTFSKHKTSVNLVIKQAANRGDYIAVIDVAPYGSTINTTTNAASSVDSSFAATYWPWLQTVDPDTGEFVWVPASTMIPAVYAFNDSVSEPWFAPAGLNRGALSNVVRAERKLSNTDRDTLYLGNVNPIATFPNTGVVVYGQKTLQKKASALDRVNVRRLLISLKEYISNISQFLVFEQNTISTRNQFLSQVNPYLESVQQRQGLYAFKVVMDDSNNTPDVIDRNQLVGQIYLQPTKTAEFIILDFNVLPTGATFG